MAVIRAASGERLADVAEALLAGGVEVMEVTFTVPQAHRVLEQVAERLGDTILLGAGTVLDTETARIALLSGAEFIVSPTVNLDVIRLCRRYDKLVMPGAFTPTEVLTAWEAGADIVKIFPSDITGPAYLKALLRPAAAGPPDAHRRRESANGRRLSAGRGVRTGSWWLAGRPAGGRRRRSERIESLARAVCQTVRDRQRGLNAAG